ncbi:unnamed protein product, partial [Brachionus calyciflorus]
MSSFKSRNKKSSNDSSDEEIEPLPS